jgi:hypothetical protein
LVTRVTSVAGSAAGFCLHRKERGYRLRRRNETIQNFACDLQKMLDVPVRSVPLPLSVAQRMAQQEGTSVFLQVPGEWGYTLQIESELSGRERRMLDHITQEYMLQVEKSANLASHWLARSMLNRKNGGMEESCPEIIEELFSGGQVYYPFLLNEPLPQGSEELLGNYFGSPVELVQYEDGHGQPYTSLLVLMQDEAGEEERLEEWILEWAEGLALLLEEELGKEMAIGGFYPVSSPSDWMGALSQMQHEFETYPEFYQGHTNRRSVYVPWRFPADKLVSFIPVEQQDQFIQTYVHDLKDTIRFLFEKEGARTVEAFFEQNLNVSETARVLHVHRNTLLYRLDKVKSLTGLDPKNFEEAFLIKVVLLLIQQTVQSAR